MITPADLLAPAGPIEAALFPGEGDGIDGTDLYERLDAYITRAQTVTSGIAFPDPDPAVKAYSLYLAFDAAYMVSVARPSADNSLVPVLGSESYSKDQRDALKAKADLYFAEYRDLLVLVPPASGTIVPVGIPTRSTPTLFDY
jgi:hypothetical protein